MFTSLLAYLLYFTHQLAAGHIFISAIKIRMQEFNLFLKDKSNNK